MTAQIDLYKFWLSMKTEEFVVWQVFTGVADKRLTDNSVWNVPVLCLATETVMVNSLPASYFGLYLIGGGIRITVALDNDMPRGVSRF